MHTRGLRAQPRSTDRGSELTREPNEHVAERSRFLAARDEFANAFGDLAKGKRNWQLMALVVSAVLGIVTIAYIRLASAARVVPYIVEVNRLGQVMGVGTAERMVTPDERLVASQLAQFIRAIRTVLPDAAAAGQAEMIRRGYAFVAPEAGGALNEYFANPRNDPRVLGARLSRQVDVTAVLRVPKSDVWRIQWTETEQATQAGGLTLTTAWEGYVTTKVVPPNTAEGIQDNPLGLFVTSFNWTQVGQRRASESATSTDPSTSQSDTSH